jgi:hypothetical protein
MTQGADRRGKGTVGRLLAYSGVKSVPVDPKQNAVNLAYAREQEIQKRQHALNSRASTRRTRTPEYTKLSAQLKIVKQIAYQGKASLGYKVLPTQGGPAKVRVVPVARGCSRSDNVEHQASSSLNLK